MKLFVSSLILFSCLNLFSQEPSLTSGYSNPVRKQYLDKIAVLEPQFQVNPTKESAIDLADAFLYIKKYKKAISFYEFARNINKLDEKQSANYFAALFEFGDLKMAHQVAKEHYMNFGKMQLKTKYDSFESLRKATPVFTENYLAMNTKFNEFGLYPLFADYRVLNSDFNMNNSSTSSINPYVFSMVDMENNSPKLNPILKEENMFNMITYYDEKEKKVYITKNPSSKYSLKLNSVVNKTMKIYIATLNPFFKLEDMVEFKYNSNEYSVGQPCMTKDGLNLYFISDMPGGYGGTDIWRCMKLEDGSWGAPINLGENINTSEDEMYPYISPKGNILFFSSLGHSILGGLDICKSIKTRFNTFSKPQNLGVPFNSNKDDFGIIFIDKNGSEGFFSSNRLGGVGGIDAYHFKNYEQDFSEQETSKTIDSKKVDNSNSSNDKVKPIIEDDEVDFRSKKSTNNLTEKVDDKSKDNSVKTTKTPIKDDKSDVSF